MGCKAPAAEKYLSGNKKSAAHPSKEDVHDQPASHFYPDVEYR